MFVCRSWSFLSMLRVVCVVACVAAAVHSAEGAVPKAETLALYDLYSSANGSQWTLNTGRLTGDPCDNHWLGVVCDASNSTVTAL